MVFGVQALGLVELVLEGDDAAGGAQSGAGIEQGPHPGGQTQLVARVTAVATTGALGFRSFASSRLRRNPGVAPINSAARTIVYAG